MAAGDGGRALGVAQSNPLLDGLKVTSVIEADNATVKLGFFGVTPVVQPVGATQATIVATMVAISSGFGFTTSDQVNSIIAAVQQIQTVLKTLGLWKGSA
jgi:hypothetical protein